MSCDNLRPNADCKVEFSLTVRKCPNRSAMIWLTCASVFTSSIVDKLSSSVGHNLVSNCRLNLSKLPIGIQGQRRIVQYFNNWTRKLILSVGVDVDVLACLTKNVRQPIWLSGAEIGLALIIDFSFPESCFSKNLIASWHHCNHSQNNHEGVCIQNTVDCRFFCRCYWEERFAAKMSHSFSCSQQPSHILHGSHLQRLLHKSLSPRQKDKENRKFLFPCEWH